MTQVSPGVCRECAASVDGKRHFCEPCKLERKRAQCRAASTRWRAGNLEQARRMTREGMARARTNDREKFNERKRFRAYRLTRERFDLMRERQSYRCAVCGIHEDDTPRGLFVDHDHACCPGNSGACGECNRGLLCPNCNTAIGMLCDDPARLRAAADYLERDFNA